jgi:hypothetical protein
VDLHVDVDGATGVPAGVDRLELGDAVGIRQLDAAQERPGFRPGASFRTLARVATRVGLDPGVIPLGITVPDIDLRIGQHRAGIDVGDRDAQAER